MPNITERISLLDELRGKTCRDNDWYRKYYEQVQYDGSIHDVHEGVFTIDEDGEADDITFSDSEAVSEYVVALHNNYEALRQAALDGERYRKAGEELVRAVERMYTDDIKPICRETSDWWEQQRDAALANYRQAVEQKPE